MIPASSFARLSVPDEPVTDIDDMNKLRHHIGLMQKLSHMDTDTLRPFDFDELFNELWPICRSITGDGLWQSLKILNRVVPIDISERETGLRCFDWEVPLEWNINEACMIPASSFARLSVPDEPVTDIDDMNKLRHHIGLMQKLSHMDTDTLRPFDFDELFNELWPICRSITGDGLWQSLKILNRVVPIDISERETGLRCFDREGQ